MTKTPSERIADIKAKEDQLAARRVKLEAQVRAKERKNQTRRKFLIGELVLTTLQDDPALAAIIRRLVEQNIKKHADLNLFGDLYAPPRGGR